MIYSDLIILAMTIGPMVPTERFSDISRFLDGRPVISIAQSAFIKGLEFSKVPTSRSDETIRNFISFVSEKPFSKPSVSGDAYHLLL